MFAILFILFLFSYPHAAHAESFEDIILEVSTQGGAVLSDPIAGLVKRQDIYLPLLDSARVLGIHIEQLATDKFEIFSAPGNSVVLDTSSCEKSKMELLCQNTLRHQNLDYISAIYLREQLLWPIQVDSRNMRLVITTEETTTHHNAKPEDKTKPVKIQRDNIATPSIHAEVSYVAPDEQKSASIYASNPLLQQDSTLFYQSTNQENILRWTLSKEYSPTEAQNAHPTNYELFSTQTIDLKYIAVPQQVTGFKITNRKKGETNFDTQSIFEKGPPRWKVELFVNSLFIGETLIGADGSYSFLNVPVFYGSTKLVFKFTSPLGSTYEQIKNFDVTDEFSQPHKINYHLDYGQAEKAPNQVGNMQIDYGVSRYLTAKAGLSQIFYTNKNKLYSLIGANFLQPYYSIAVQNLNSLENTESAFSVTPKLNLGSTLLSTEYTKFNGLETSIVNSNQLALKKISALSRPFEKLPMSMQIQISQTDFVDSPSTQEAQLRLYTLLNRKSVLAEISKTWPSNEEPEYYFEVGNYFDSLRVKYGSFFQNNKYNRSKVELEKSIGDNSLLIANLVLPSDFQKNSYVLGINSLCGLFLCEFQITHDSRILTYGFLLSTNYRPSAPIKKVDPITDYRLGKIDLIAFVDENANGVFDINEKAYPHLRILHIQTQKEYTADREGLVSIAAVQPYQKISFEVVKESISNIFLSARDFSTDYMLTPSQAVRIEIPIIPSFEIKGTIKNKFFKKLVPLQIVNFENEILSETTSSASGTFLFEDIPAGTYRMRIQPEFISQNSLTVDPSDITLQLQGKAGVRTTPTLSLSKSND